MRCVLVVSIEIHKELDLLLFARLYISEFDGCMLMHVSFAVVCTCYECVDVCGCVVSRSDVLLDFLFFRGNSKLSTVLVCILYSGFKSKLSDLSRVYLIFNGSNILGRLECDRSAVVAGCILHAQVNTVIFGFTARKHDAELARDVAEVVVARDSECDSILREGYHAILKSTI